MDSAAWIDHFYRNACQSRRLTIPPHFGAEDRKCLQAVRPGQLSLRSGKVLMEKSRCAAAQGTDLSFAWAVRLFVAEQARQNHFWSELAPGVVGTQPVDWRGTVIGALPADLIMLLLGCRSRVAARFFGALARKTDCPSRRALYERLKLQELGQLQFSAFAGPRFSEASRRLPRVVVRGAEKVVTVGIATRVWLRQRNRLRESGQTFAGFVSALLEPATL